MHGAIRAREHRVTARLQSNGGLMHEQPTAIAARRAIGHDGSGWARAKGVMHRSTSNSAAGSTPKAANDNLAGESLTERGLRGER